MSADRPMLGILLMLGFCVLAPMGDSMAKILGGSIPLGEMLLVRFALQAALLFPLLMLIGQPIHMTRRVVGLTLLRTVFHLVAMAAMYTALRFMPLAETVAIAFVMPFIMLFLGWFFLSEVIGRFRIIACLIGFIGTLFVVQPSFAAVGWPALLPIAVAVLFALFMLVTRLIAKDNDPIVLQAVSGLMATVIMLAALLIPTDTPALTLIWPNSTELILLAGIGILGTVAHLMMTWSLRFAPSATLAPMQYLEIPIATIIGWLVFKDLPNGLAAIGICITISAGLYIIYRERVSANILVPDPPDGLEVTQPNARKPHVTNRRIR